MFNIISAESPPIISSEQKEVFIRRTGELVDYAHENKVGVVFFMDKSARPLAQMFWNTWHQRFGPDIPHPEIRYFNIGTEQVRYFFDQLLQWSNNPQQQSSKDKNFIYQYGMWLGNMNTILNRTGLGESTGIPDSIFSDLEKTSMPIETIFGKENISNFLKQLTHETKSTNIIPFKDDGYIPKYMLWPSKELGGDKLNSNNRMIIDDVRASGWTQEFTELLIQYLDRDPNHRYIFEVFLRSKDTDHFEKNQIYLPWHEKGSPDEKPAHLVKEPENKQDFFTRRETGEIRERGLKVRKEIIGMFPKATK